MQCSTVQHIAAPSRAERHAGVAACWRTICLHDAIGEEERQRTEREPCAKLQAPVPVLQQLAACIAAVPHAEQRSGQGSKVQAAAHTDAIHRLLTKPLVARFKTRGSTHDPCEHVVRDNM